MPTISRLSFAAVLAVALLGLAACAQDGFTGSTSSPRPTPTAEPTPTDTATPEAGPIAGFVLSGSELVAYDADGVEAERVSLDDSASLLTMLEEVFGDPVVQPATTECAYEFVTWFDGGVYVAHEPADVTSAVVVVKAEHGIRPSAGPTLGESTDAFVATLPADQVTGNGYIYDKTGTLADGSPSGGAVHGFGSVDAIASPSSPLVVEFCG